MQIHARNPVAVRLEHAFDHRRIVDVPPRIRRESRHRSHWRNPLCHNRQRGLVLPLATKIISTTAFARSSMPFSNIFLFLHNRGSTRRTAAGL